MLTIRPAPRAAIPWRTAWVVLRTPFRLTAMRRSQSAGSLSAKKCSRSQPALLTRTSSGPSAPSIAATARPTASRSATSAAAAALRPPAARTSAATASAVAPSRSTIPTASPSRASRSAMARPIPRPAPVTSATEPTALLPAARKRRREAAAHGDLALLVDGLHLAVDPPLAVGLVLPHHLAPGDDRVAGPDARCEADLQASEVLGPDVVGHAAAHERGGQHAVAEDTRLAGHVGERLVVMDRVEVAGRAG